MSIVTYKITLNWQTNVVKTTVVVLRTFNHLPFDSAAASA